jgi:hypothetical protein
MGQHGTLQDSAGSHADENSNQDMLILQSHPPSSTAGQQSGGSSADVDEPAQKSKQLQQRWISRVSSLYQGNLGGENDTRDTRVGWTPKTDIPFM